MTLNYDQLKKLKQDLSKKVPKSKTELLKSDLKKLKKEQEREALQRIFISALKATVGGKLEEGFAQLEKAAVREIAIPNEFTIKREVLDGIQELIVASMPEMPEKMQVDVINQLKPDEIAKTFAEEIRKALPKQEKPEKEVVKVIEALKVTNLGIVERELKKLTKASTKAKEYTQSNPLPVRLSNGKAFYDALSTFVTSGIIDSVSKGYLQSTALNTARLSELGSYEISDTDDDAEPNYYGYLKSSGEWYIMKEESGAYRYVKGDDEYTTAWTDRASQSYDYFDEVFG